MIKNGDKIVVWFSCGAASAVAAKMILSTYGNTAYIKIVNNPILEEDADNRRFLKDVEQWLGVRIDIVTNPDWPAASAREVWAKRKAMSFPYGAPCTDQLKKKARQHYENVNKPDWHVLGFTYDEKHRSDNFILSERRNTIPILINYKITKNDCYRIIMNAGLRLPDIYLRGYPNANCIGCVKATSPTYWNHVRKNDPDVFEDRARQSRELGVKLVRVNNKRIFLDELNPEAKGKPMKNLDFECGIFCEEKSI